MRTCPLDAFDEPFTPSFAGMEQLASVCFPDSSKEPTAAPVPFSLIPGFQYQLFHGSSAPSAAFRYFGNVIAPWPATRAPSDASDATRNIIAHLPPVAAARWLRVLAG